MSTKNPELLYVDLDGTLIATDILWESLCLLVRRHPFQLLAMPFWLLSGKGNLKNRIAELVRPDVTLLPYREEVLEFLRCKRRNGHRLILATASHESVAREVAEELGLFDRVLATTRNLNLRGSAKLEAIREDAGQMSFGYIGDNSTDLPVWNRADRAIVVGPSTALRRAVQRLSRPNMEVIELTASKSGLRAILKALRPHQWAKNILLFAPIVLGQKFTDPDRLLAVAIGFLAFCVIASTGYLVNDMLDIEADRRHATKCRRLFAAGRLSLPVGLGLIATMLVLGFGLAISLVSMSFAGMLLAYLSATLAYSLFLKERLFVDVLILASLYTHRVLSGGVAADVAVSPWLLAFSVFFFMSLALVKRYVELVGMAKVAESDGEQIFHRAYRMIDTGLVETMGISSGYISVLVLGLYVSRDDVTRHYATPEVLWLVMPLMLYWISRVWFLAGRSELPEDPVLFAVTDRNSYIIFALITCIGGFAALWGR